MSRRTVLLMLALAALGLGAYACWPRKADLRSFDPGRDGAARDRDVA